MTEHAKNNGGRQHDQFLIGSRAQRSMRTVLREQNISPVTPVIAILACLGLMLALPLEIWIRFVGWLAVGLLIYYGFGKLHSKLEAPTAPH